MQDMKLTGRTIAVLEQSLNLRARNQQVIAGNLANAETPGYAAKRLSFEDDLQRAISRPELDRRPTNPRHIPIGAMGIEQVQGRVTEEINNSAIGDGNSVSMEEEMLALSENQLLYEAGTQILKKKLSLLKYVAADGR